LGVIEGHAAKSSAQILEGLSQQRKEFSDNMKKLMSQITGLPVSILPRGERLIGRENIMETLKNALEERGGMAALVGGGGMGKTSCAKQFAKNFVTKDPEKRFVFWLSSETKDSIFVSYTRALKSLRESSGESANDADEKEVTLEKLALDVWDRLQTKSNRFEWLLVFDNVPEVEGERAGLAAFEDKYFPNADGTLGRILFTTRSFNFCGRTQFGEITAIEVPKLDEKSAKEMFKTIVAPHFFSEDAARELVTVYFDGLPLAIASAAGEITGSKTQTSAYLAKLKSGTRNLTVNSVRDKVFLILKSALEYARMDDGARRVLDIAAFLNPDRIEKKLLLQQNDDDDDNAIGLLCSLCLFHRLDDLEETYSMHRLHQEAARNDRSPVEAMKAIMKENSVLEESASSTWNSRLDIHTHAQALTGFVEDSSLTADNQIDYANILSISGNALRLFYNFRGALGKYEKALEIFWRVHGKTAENNDVAMTLVNLGIVHRDLGEYVAATDNIEKALKMMRNMYGENAKNDALARTLGKRGRIKSDRGMYREALMDFEKELEMLWHVHGQNAENEDLAMTLDSLGCVHLDLGNHDAALKNFEEALEMMRHVYGENAENDNLARVMNNLGDVQVILNNYDVAFRYVNKSFEMMQHLYGENAENDNLAGVLDTLGTIEINLGNYNAAVTNFEKALEMLQHLYGENPENDKLALVMNNLGEVQVILHNYNAALANFEKALEMMRHVYNVNAENVNLATTLKNLGEVHSKLGNVENAQNYCKEAMEMLRDCLGDDALTNKIFQCCLRISKMSEQRCFERCHKIIETLEQRCTICTIL
jgi:tetratricopeptide (TPR) repeat protein